jgi:hypothetical protein
MNEKLMTFYNKAFYFQKHYDARRAKTVLNILDKVCSIVTEEREQMHGFL